MPRDPGKTAKRQTLRQQRVLNPRHGMSGTSLFQNSDIGNLTDGGLRWYVATPEDSPRISRGNLAFEAAGIWINHVDDRILGVVSREESADRQLETVTVLA